MSNHVHFVLYGTGEEVEVFIQRFKGRYSQYYCRKWRTKELLRLHKVDIKELPSEQEARERAIAYVMMNCVAAGICTHPSLYPWGCGSALFAVQVGGIGNYVAGGDGRDGISEGKLAGIKLPCFFESQVKVNDCKTRIIINIILPRRHTYLAGKRDVIRECVLIT